MINRVSGHGKINIVPECKMKSQNKNCPSSKSSFQTTMKSIEEKHIAFKSPLSDTSIKSCSSLLDINKKLDTSLQTIMSRSSDVNSIIESLDSGNELNNTELLRMQGVLLNYSLDLTTVSKLIEQTIGSIKTVLQTQV